MTNFVLLYNGGGMPETEEEQAAVMAAWNAWYGSIGENLADGGGPFSPMANTVNSDGSVSAGGVPTQSTGFTIVSVDSLEAATEIAKGCPILTDGGQVSVYEAMPM